MPRAAWGIVCCALAAGGGCDTLFPPARPAGERSLPSAIPADTLVVESILLERPFGDPFLDRGLWKGTLVTWSPETRELLARNGLQSGVLSGNLPTEFQAIVETKADVVDQAHLTTFNHRKDAVIPTAGPWPSCKFDLLADLAGKPVEVSLKDAKCGIMVVPQVLSEGRVKIRCEPQIQHGDREERYRPSEDGTQFMKYQEVPTEKYPALSFETVLRVDECLVIGCIADDRETLGAVLFGAEAMGHPRQRLLAIRARVVNVSPTAGLPAILPPGRCAAPVK